MSKKPKRYKEQFSKNKIDSIIAALKSGASNRDVSKRYGVSISYINSIIASYGLNKDNEEENIDDAIDITDDIISEEEIEVPVDDEMEEDMVEEKVRKKKHHLSDKEKELLINLSDTLTVSELGQRFDISVSTVNRIKKRYKLPKVVQVTKDDVVFEQVEVPTEKEEENEHMVKLSFLPFVNVGLVDERHVMPCKRYIYSDITSDTMFDYDYLYRTAKEEIKSIVSWDKSGPLEGIRLYVTGLQCALASVIKACYELNIDLVLMHYNASCKTYCEQPVFNFHPASNCDKVFYDMVHKNRNVYFYDCSSDDILGRSTFYEIVEAYYTSTKTIQDIDIVLFTDQTKAWEYYQPKAMEMINHKAVYLNMASINHGKYVRGNNITKCVNY